MDRDLKDGDGIGDLQTLNPNASPYFDDYFVAIPGISEHNGEDYANKHNEIFF